MTDHEKLIQHLKGIRRIVINACHGGFSLSEQAESRYKELAGITDDDWWYRDVDRDDPYLVQVVREMGRDANGRFAELKIVEIPADVEWGIEEYDGSEWVAEKHRTWS